MVVKQQVEKEAAEESNEAPAELSERIDLVYAKDIDRVIDHLKTELLLDLSDFQEFMHESYSLEKSAFTISLA